MAGDAAFSSSSTCMTLFFSLLLAFHFVVAVPGHRFSPLTSTKESAKKRNTMVAASAREGGAQNPKRDIVTPKETTKGIHVPEDKLQHGSKRRNSRAPRPPLQWQNKIFNASEHEVPSGPNPISNR